MGLQLQSGATHCYRPQMTFGTTKRLSFCSRGGVSAYRGSAYGGLHGGEGVSQILQVCIWGEGWTDPPPESEKRAVGILLECFLVFSENNIASVIAELSLTLGVNGP